ncbi:YciI family protein [Sodalis sp. dw_96]|uniref:YciI family protein n=1 Tax=Sodalis sp. dw_96 TaxID=2719794 RepID=UPI001BD643AB|nr:YciI family protein [Sodalis sp. dw_96]
MNTYVVRMDHPDGPEWNTFVMEHVLYLKKLIDEGKLIASGPLKGTPLRAGFLIFRTDQLEEVKALVAGDPFARENLIARLDIQEWDPLFGLLSDISSKIPPEELRALFEEDGGK